MFPSRIIPTAKVIVTQFYQYGVTRINFYKFVFYRMRKVIQRLLCYDQRSLFGTFVFFTTNF